MDLRAVTMAYLNTIGSEGRTSGNNKHNSWRYWCPMKTLTSDTCKPQITKWTEDLARENDSLFHK